MSLTRQQFMDLKKYPFFRGKVVTNSMDPIIKVGDEIIVDIGAKELKRFDIVVIFSGDKLICHYLWKKNKIVEPILLQTRGLRGSPDRPVELQDYLGKVVNFRLSWWHKLKFLLAK